MLNVHSGAPCMLRSPLQVLLEERHYDLEMVVVKDTTAFAQASPPFPASLQHRSCLVSFPNIAVVVEDVTSGIANCGPTKDSW